MRPKYLVIYTTFPSLRSAKKIIGDMVSAEIVACGNIFKIFSIYRWQGRIEKNPEYGVLMKTRRSKYRTAERHLKKNHPYRVPEIIAWDIDQGQKDYLDWIKRATK